MTDQNQDMNNQVQDIKQEDLTLEGKRFNIKLDRDGKQYVFSVPDGTPFGQAYDACLQILLALKDMINKSAESIIAESTPKETNEVIDSDLVSN